MRPKPPVLIGQSSTRPASRACSRFTLMFSSFNTVPQVSDDPSIFAALREQLGLKLEPARGPVELLVIDSVEQPTPN